jgi:hypothetical protein
MARNVQPANDMGKIKLRFVDLELEGSARALEESIRGLITSMSRTAATAPRLAVGKNGSSSRPPTETTATDVSDEDDGDEDEATMAAADDDVAAPVKQSKATTRVPPQPKFLQDLDVNMGVPLRDLATEKSPSSHYDKALLIAFWCKNHAKLESFSIDHIFTCYRAVGWTLPGGDLMQFVRDLKSKKSYFVKGPTRGHYVLHYLGEEVVMKMGSQGNGA